MRHCPLAFRNSGLEQSASFCASGSGVKRSASPGVKLFDNGYIVASLLFWSWICLRYSHRSPTSKLNRELTLILSCANKLNHPPPVSLLINGFFVKKPLEG